MPKRFWKARSSSPSFLAAQINDQATTANVKTLTTAINIPRTVLTAAAYDPFGACGRFPGPVLLWRERIMGFEPTTFCIARTLREPPRSVRSRQGPSSASPLLGVFAGSSSSYEVVRVREDLTKNAEHRIRGYGPSQLPGEER